MYRSVLRQDGFVFSIEGDGTYVRRISRVTGKPPAARPDALTEQAMRELREYFAGTRKAFSVPILPEGTAFQKRVWQALRAIPYGGTRSYAEVAEAAGAPGAALAAGQAIGANPIPVLIPCHRVIRADGSIGGFSGGLDLKRYLLNLENKTK